MQTAHELRQAFACPALLLQQTHSIQDKGESKTIPEKSDRNPKNHTEVVKYVPLQFFEKPVTGRALRTEFYRTKM